MIVSHKHRFIYVHLPRTGGCSLTASLAEICGPDDIITPLRGEENKHVARNCEGIRRHATAKKIRAHVGEEVWNDYFKFTLDRNPWDKILSRHAYYQRSRGELFRKLTGKDPSLETYFTLRLVKQYTTNIGRPTLPNYNHFYVEKGKLVVDFVGRLENRAAHLSEVARRIGVNFDTGIWINKRGDRVPYTEMFQPWMLPIIERVFAKDLELLRYEYGKPHPTNYIERGPDGEAVYREPTEPATAASK